MEAVDLGVRLCQSAARSVYPCYALAVVIWWAKPWLDRTILFVLSRAAFGQHTDPADVWRAQREVWWRQTLFTVTIRRLSLWRSLTQPVYQLEGLSIRDAGARVRQIRRRHVASGLMVSSAFSMAELALAIALASLVFWFAPSGLVPDVAEVIFGGTPGIVALVVPIASAAAILVVEPFYVAAGFAMYLNRRAELEGWDIEQEFRRAFAH